MAQSSRIAPMVAFRYALVASLPVLLAAAELRAAQRPVVTDAARYAARRERVYSYITRRLAEDPRVAIRVDGDFDRDVMTGWVDTALDSIPGPRGPRWAWLDALERRWPNATFVSARDVVDEVRAVKDPGEVAALRRVAANSATALRAGMARFAPGRHQRDVEGTVVAACTANGGGGHSFWPWVMSGPNAAFPTPLTSSVDLHNLDRMMRAGEVVRLDVGCQVDHYMGDVGRTVPVTGTFTPGQAEVIDLMVAAYRAGLAVLRDGVADTTVIRASTAEAARRRGSMRTALGRRAAALIADRDSIPFWQIHGVGLDIAEGLPAVLRAGMVLDYEPIFVVDGQGFFMEDMILVTPTGHEILTEGLPTTAAEIERAMRGRSRESRGLIEARRRVRGGQMRIELAVDSIVVTGRSRTRRSARFPAAFARRREPGRVRRSGEPPRCFPVARAADGNRRR
jgi:Xaa-Pro aminopeptidase